MAGCILKACPKQLHGLEEGCENDYKILFVCLNGAPLKDGIALYWMGRAGAVSESEK